MHSVVIAYVSSRLRILALGVHRADGVSEGSVVLLKAALDRVLRLVGMPYRLSRLLSQAPEDGGHAILRVAFLVLL